MKLSLPLICAWMLLSACTRTTEVTVHAEHPVQFLVEVADNTVTRSLGLMFRNRLADDRGMLFVYETPGQKHFWMKYTRIPLDIIFIDQEKRITNIEEAEPCVSSPCRRFLSRGEVQFVLEINQGLSRRYGFTEGSRVDFEWE